MYRLNPFVHIFERDNIKALFNSLTLSTVYITSDKYENIVNKPSKELIDNDFFVPVDFKPIDTFYKFIKSKENDNNINIAYFLITSQCNFDCKYCFVESRFKENENAYMTEDIASKAIQLIKRNTDKIKIIFYGGEPLLNFELIKFVVEEAKKNKIKVAYSLISNGGIINDEIISFLKENKFSISISLDGMADANDKVRVKHNNEGTFDSIISTIEKLKKHNVNFGISCTISPHNMNTPDEILQILDKYKIKRIGYNLLTENDNISLSRDENLLMVKNILKAEDIILEKGLIEDKVIRRKLIPFIEKKNWTQDCAGYGNQIVITPKGEVGTCHGLWPDLVNKEIKTYFDIDVNYTGKISEHPTWKEWNERLPLNMPKCWSCFGIGLCGGGCAKNSLLRKNDIWEIDEDICDLTKESVPWVVWKYYDIKVKDKIS